MITYTYTRTPVTLWQALSVALITCVVAVSAHVLPIRPRKYIAYAHPFVTGISTEARIHSLVLEFNSAQHTLGHVGCEACDFENRKVRAMESTASLPFAQAAPLWLEERRNKLAPKTFHDYEYYVRNLGKFFGSLTLREISNGHLRIYQQMRATNEPNTWKQPAGPSLINHELNALAQILTRAGLWSELEKFYEPLPVPESDVGMALEPEEEAHLFDVASRRPKWKVAYCCSLISNGTSAGPGEIRHLKLKDINMAERYIDIRRGVKNRYRIRRLPLVGDSLWAMQELMDRAHEQGAHLPEHYLLPYHPKHAGAKPDPTRPMETWRTAWRSLRNEAAKNYPRLRQMRRYDLRHNAATKLAENPNISERTAREMLGHHYASRVLDRYSHIKQKAKLEAATALDSGHINGNGAKKPSNGTRLWGTWQFGFWKV